MGDRSWYCIRSHLKHEHIAAANLRQVAGVEVLNPQLRLLRSTRRGPVWSVESLFPNYLFARFRLASMLEKIRYTPSVKTVVQFGNTVPVIPDAVIRGLERELQELKSKVLTDAPEKGEEVEVAAGAFQGFRGPVVRVLPARQRVQVLLEVMGRAITAELSMDLLLFKRREAARLVLEGMEAAPGIAPVVPVKAVQARLPRASARDYC